MREPKEGEVLAPGSKLALANNWRWFMARGVTGLFFGFVIFFFGELEWSPRLAPWARTPWVTSEIILAVYAVTDGFLAAKATGRTSFAPKWWLVLLVWAEVGVVGAVWGWRLGWRPPLEHVFAMISIWLVVMAIGHVAVALQLRKEDETEPVLLWSGGLSFGFGLLLIAGLPLTGIFWTLVISLYAVLSGALMLILAFRLRGLRQMPK